MNPVVQLLESTGDALREALACDDWAMIAVLDQRCREALDDAMVEPEDAALVRQRMEELVDLYRQLVERCHGERQRLANELRQMKQSSHGAKVYQLFG